MTLWGSVLSALAVALVAPGAASATTCTPKPVSPIVRFSTSVGNIDVRLNGTDAPCTVQNFESYMNNLSYDGSFFHRSVTSPDVIQGGGFKFSAGKPVAIPTQSPIQNEYKDPNIAGSIAMALSGTQSTTCELDASATDEWFFNVADNSQALDEQCFTVFGQALDLPSVAVINKIAGEPVCDADTAWGGTLGGTYANVPLLDYNVTANCTGTPAASGDGPEWKAGAAPITSSNLVFVNSIRILNDTSPPAITIGSPAPHQDAQSGTDGHAVVQLQRRHRHRRRHVHGSGDGQHEPVRHAPVHRHRERLRRQQRHQDDHVPGRAAAGACEPRDGVEQGRARSQHPLPLERCLRRHGRPRRRQADRERRGAFRHPLRHRPAACACR